MKIFVLAEKPDQAEKYAHTFGKPKNDKGVWKVYSDILNADVLIASAVGHLVEKDNPYKNYENWELENLPALPEKFSYKVKKGVSYSFNNIKKCIKECDCIIIATDPDREGESIAYKILNEIPGSINKVKYRLWANSLTKKGIESAFKKLRDPSETINYYHEADARDDADWLVGFNLSPFVTIKMKEVGELEKTDKVMSVGRVQTPIVSLIVRNHEEIENFVSVPFWTIEALNEEGLKFTNDVKYKSLQEATEALELMSDSYTVIDVKVENKSQTAPKLYNLTNLQSEMSKLYKVDATRTKEIVQSLYQKGFMSYPRTDSTLITTNEFEYLVANIERYKQTIGKDIETVNLTPRKEFVNDKKVVEHYAIIPTENIPNIEELDSYEKIIYQMVTFQTLLMFAEDYNYQSTTITIKNDASSVEFKVSGNVTINKGWRKYKQTKSEDKELPSLKVMDSLVLKANIKQDQTKPPARITEEYLLKKLLPKYNLGTSATRDGILDLIQEREYVKKDKKTGQFTPTIRGIKLIHFLDKLDIIYTNPETTQKWELFLAQIGQGKIRKSDFVEKVKWAISKQIEKGKQLL